MYEIWYLDITREFRSVTVAGIVAAHLIWDALNTHHHMCSKRPMFVS